MYHMIGSVIFFGGQMVTAIGQDMIVGSAVKSACVYMYHLLGSGKFGSDRLVVVDTSGQVGGGGHFGNDIRLLDRTRGSDDKI